MFMEKMSTKFINDRNPKISIILTYEDIMFMKDENAFNTFMKNIGIADHYVLCSEYVDTETNLCHYNLFSQHFIMLNKTRNQYILITVCDEGDKYRTINESIKHFFPTINQYHKGLTSFKELVFERNAPSYPCALNDLLSYIGKPEIGDVFDFGVNGVYIHGGFWSDAGTETPTFKNFSGDMIVHKFKNIMDTL